MKGGGGEEKFPQWSIIFRSRLYIQTTCSQPIFCAAWDVVMFTAKFLDPLQSFSLQSLNGALGMCMTDGNVSGRVPEWEISQLRTVVVCPCSMCVFLGQCVFSAKSLMCECSTISGKVYIFSRLPCGSASVCKQHEWLFYAFTLLYMYMWLCYSLHMWCVGHSTCAHTA